ncbi:MAG: hypothetical protein H0V19_10720 [Euzebyales bacterium]|nr:hypothetical protein [Euzebyales bacterium]
MASVNMLRGVLVAGAVLAAIVAAAYRLWPVVGVLLVAVAAHGWMWAYLHRLGQQSPPRR